MFWQRFNRYMVECEFATRNSRVASADGFNRYMVECEFGFGGIPVKASRVLIDTWWNVNVTCSKKSPLMETGFNRYMVECEFIT